ncbi:MAG: ammonia-forming cytochrome c nitrite reductase subunit c552 [Syntrophales bacterium]
MPSRRLFFVVLSALIGAAFFLPSAPDAQKTTTAQKAGPDERGKCFLCHGQVKAMYENSRHVKLSCGTCHIADDHLKNVRSKPVTVIDHTLCGKCHRDQFLSFIRVNYAAPAKREKGVPTGRSPLQDKLLAPHGFTKEHNEPRAHIFMLTDQFVVDRYAGGRFRYKDGVRGVDATGRVWDILVDTGKELPETAKAGNATCIQCKSSDHVLQWKYMGDKDPRAKWDRASDVIDISKATNNPIGCIECHDPHATGYRVIRDALIEAVDREGAATFARNGKTDLQVVDFRNFRKIGVMGRADSRMLCAQCHVEYACNPGFEFDTGKRIGFEDRRTNHFPMKSAKDILAHYKKINFYDFKHAVTGARLVKLQHPETETYWGSVHDRAGVQCHQCHMPKAKNKAGKTYTTHAMVRPIHDVKAACLGCHPNYTAEQKHYQIEAVQNYSRGKMRKAEYWLGALIDAYAAAAKAGVPESVLARAREKHEEAHVLWEWWTAENSDGWHNPELARETLTASIAASRRGIEILTGAMGNSKK